VGVVAKSDDRCVRSQSEAVILPGGNRDDIGEFAQVGGRLAVEVLAPGDDRAVRLEG
jgi:hypothetical protein